MAQAHPISMLEGFSGTIDGYVYRRYRGKTVLQRKPKFTKPWTEAQGATRKAFSGGSAFAAQVKADPALRTLYKQRGARLQLNYRQMAIRDFFRAPTVDKLLTDGYTAQAGGVLVARASDDFEVVRVTFTLQDAEGAVLAEGDAILRHTVWHFTVPPPIDGRRPISVAISAHDRPGNVTTERFPLP